VYFNQIFKIYFNCIYLRYTTCFAIHIHNEMITAGKQISIDITFVRVLRVLKCTLRKLSV
jgi:hypothetical protein